MITFKPLCSFSGRVFTCFIAAAIPVLINPGGINAQEVLTVGNFSAAIVSEKTLPENWEPMTFKKIDSHTRYDTVDENGLTVIRAQSKASSSGLIRKIQIDPKTYPIIQWRWKITGVYQNGDVTKNAGDDYPARIYIAFAYDPDRVGFFEKAKFKAVKVLYGEYPPSGAINYIWASRAPKETRVPNPFVDRVMMIAVESGPAMTNTWVTEERNIYQDYLNSYGQPPPMISGVAIMTDSDNTGESATSFYGDIIFKSGIP